ncbi:c-type cytochrome [Tamlana sp. I1]|uniref:c-type cytochrome n=1 Tax=Tamlana sp. I1 TaxID=2762061 RepID=UPI00188E534B|nr:cytochrome c [Tamlana sp. I1]
MKKSLKVLLAVLVTTLIACGEKEEKKKAGFSYENTSTETTSVEATKNLPPSKTIDLTSKGIGAVTSLTLDANINTELAKTGSKIFNRTCTSCHRTDKKFIGPAPKDILKRRTPEWVMNIMLNPEKMVKQDSLAKALLAEFNGSPMPYQGLTEDDARALLEYFRTL